MRKLFIIINLLFSVYSIGQTQTAENGIQTTLISKAQAEMIYNHVKSFPNNTEISIGIIQKQQTVFIGIKRVNDTIVAYTNKQKIFEIGSISKVFTSTLLTNAVITGKVKLNDSIQNYIKIKPIEPITFQMLANHTSGLPRLPSNLNLFTVDPNNPYKEYDSQKLKDYLIEKIELKQKPGIKYEYSNLGAGLLGYILTEIEHSSYERLLQEQIFSKYEMPNSTSNIKSIKEGLIKGLNAKGEKTDNWNFDVLAGAGGIFSSVYDLSKFATAQFNNENKELMLTHTATFSVNNNMKIGLGWHLLTKKNLIWHNGGTGGYTSSMAIKKENQTGIIILSNVSAFHKNRGKIDELCFGLIKTLEKQ